MDTQQKRLILRVVAKLMLLFFGLALLWIFVRSLPGPSLQQQTVQIELNQLQYGQILRYDWQGRRILILRRPLVDAKQDPLRTELLDPDSLHSRQPRSASNPWRSLVPDYFVALDYGSDLNCALDYLSPESEGPPGRLWLGGFKDRCRGSWYDLAGRVYKGQQAQRNLTVPAYSIDGTTLSLGAE